MELSTPLQVQFLSALTAAHRRVQHLEEKLAESEGISEALHHDYSRLWTLAWAVCQEQAERAPSLTLLALLRGVQSHLGTVPPTCACNACALERQIIAALASTHNQ